MIAGVSAVEIPKYHELFWPVLQAVNDLGGSASISEMVDAVVRREGFADEQQAVLHKDGPGTEIGYRIAWCRTYLKAMGFLTNSARGVWTVTDAATALLGDQTLTDDQRQERVRSAWGVLDAHRHKARRAGLPQHRGDTRAGNNPSDAGDEPPDVPDWKEQLLDLLMAMTPDAFERLAKRLLRESSFASVTVTGKTGDQGIDGLGIYKMGLVSFPVFFQCKRYRGSVGPSAVRDFRGAMSGRGDKGLLITTGTFTAEAKKESNRQGTTPVDLIDGEELCALLKERALGVHTETRQEETVTVDPSFFSAL